MATRFELVLHGASEVALRAAGEEALSEIDRLERQLSLFRPESEIAHLNRSAARAPVPVSPETFALLERAKNLNLETSGAFDITIAPLVRCWGFLGGSGKEPDPGELARCRDKIGMHLVELKRADRTVRFLKDGVMLDLGAIGKGYAVEKAAELLRDAGISSALIHGGTSTVCALGSPPNAPHWTLAIQTPLKSPNSLEALPQSRHTIPQNDSISPSPDTRALFASEPLLVRLRDEALSVSGIRGKYFESEGRILGHVLDPRTGQPATGTAMAAVVLPSATDSDALSTALLVLGPQGHDLIHRLRPGIRTALLTESARTELHTFQL